MLNENGLTFKDFEKKTFEMICKLGQEYTRDFLERYDTYLMDPRYNGGTDGVKHYGDVLS